MALHFPNQSRYYDTTRRAVGFWAYDSSMETAFFVAESALRRLQPDMPGDETSILRTFDAHRDRILRAASKVYSRGSKGAYDLIDNDF
jgi:hypothetical protein